MHVCRYHPCISFCVKCLGVTVRVVIIFLFSETKYSIYTILSNKEPQISISLIHTSQLSTVVPSSFFTKQRLVGMLYRANGALPKLKINMDGTDEY